MFEGEDLKEFYEFINRKSGADNDFLKKALTDVNSCMHGYGYSSIRCRIYEGKMAAFLAVLNEPRVFQCLQKLLRSNYWDCARHIMKAGRYRFLLRGLISLIAGCFWSV